jgi:septum site-determining protein MinC
VALLSELGQRSVRVMGLDGVESAWLPMGMPPLISRARQAGMREITLAAGLTASSAESTAEEATDEPDISEGLRSAKIIEGPVRSGQSVIHPDGDVVVVGSVASGAEVIAGGSIHIYGALRGRACAGAAEEEGARIFCGRLEAEFVSIGAVFITAETIDPEFRGKRVQARLDGIAICFDLLN